MARGKEGARKLDRGSRALCRILYNDGWSQVDIAKELQCSGTTVSRVLINKFQDCVSEDPIHVHAEDSLKYGLLTSGHVSQEGSGPIESDHRIRCTPVPQPRPASFGPGRSKGMSPQQRALVRLLSSRDQTATALAAHFNVSSTMIKYATDNSYNPPDDTHKDSVLAPPSEVERHLSLINAASTLRRTDPAKRLSGPSSPMIRIRPRSRLDLGRNHTTIPNLLTDTSINSSQRRENRRTVQPITSMSLPGADMNAGTLANSPTTDAGLSAALAQQSLQHLAGSLAKLGIKDVKTLKQANQLDVPANLVAHDFWRPLIDTGVMTTLEFFLLQQIASSH